MGEKKEAFGSVRWGFILLGLLGGAVFGSLVYFAAAALVQDVQPLLAASEISVPEANVWSRLTLILPRYWYMVFPAIVLISILTAWIVWRCVRPGLRRSQTAVKRPSFKPEAESKEAELAQRRLFLHLFAAMQRDGRLMDFLSEDLEPYEDAQIGAAVRNIHAGCRQVVQKYLNPEPVMTEEEGETVNLPADFDPALVTVTGKVTGKPPFSGILRHKGWQAADIKLPELSGRQNARVIAPAEVEIP
ncbi:MAG TPA: DUF2760 domain-containing protein [Desulfobacterales bacterium]